MRPPRYSALTAATTALLTTTGRASSVASVAAAFSSSQPSAFVGRPIASRLSAAGRYFAPQTTTTNHLLSVRLKMTATDAASSDEKDQAVRTIQSDGGYVKMMVHHLLSVGSTQDEARRMLVENASSKKEVEEKEEAQHTCLAASASEQTKGRGTSGRDWIGKGGNTFVTVCVPSDCIINIPVTLLPLKVGSIVAQLAHERLRSQKAWAKVAVKWPNDVLVEDKKIAGILIESHYDEVAKESWYLIGIGVNVAHAPTIDLAGPQRGRRSTCLANHCNVDGDGVETARELAYDIAKGIHGWVSSSLLGGENVDKSIAAEAIVREWSDWAEFGKEQVLRDKPGNEVVTPVGIEADGRLRVRGRNGKEQLLVADYLL